MGFFFVKFVIAIPSLFVVFKPLLAPPSFSMEKVGGAFFSFKFVCNIPLSFVEDIVIFRVFFFLRKFQL